jgi:hypothetical protein
MTGGKPNGSYILARNITLRSPYFGGQLMPIKKNYLSIYLVEIHAMPTINPATQHQAKMQDDSLLGNVLSVRVACVKYDLYAKRKS